MGVTTPRTIRSPSRWLISIYLFAIVGFLQLVLLYDNSRALGALKTLFTSNSRQDWNDIRLPPFIKAISYKLNFTTDLDLKQDFGGMAEITLNVTETTKFIAVHQVGLDLVFESLVTVNTDGSRGRSYFISKRELKPEFEYTLFSFSQPIVPSIVRMKIAYKGQLSNSLAGYYLSTYHLDGEQGQGHHIATTQFEPTDARRAFPCLDEPSQKATFEIIMAVQSQYHALSNMPVKSKRQISNSNWTEYHFEKSVRMSTYLVAFIVSDFVSISAKTKSGVTVSVWTAPTKAHLGEYALSVGVPILEFYEKTFGIDFPLPKMDMIAIPDFSAGAMVKFNASWPLLTSLRALT